MNIVQQLKESIFKLLSGFRLNGDDRLVAITDPGVDRDVREALQDAVLSTGMAYNLDLASILMSGVPTGSAQAFSPEIEAEMADATALLYLTSMSRSHCKQTHKFVTDRRDGRTPARLISITNGRSETLLVGAANEDFEAMRRRIARINGLTRNVVRYHVTAPNGTDLWTAPILRYSISDDGLIDTPGKLGNFPFGEGRSTAVYLGMTDGVVFSDCVIGSGIGRPDKSIRLEIANGRIETVTGGESAGRLLKLMREANKRDDYESKLENPAFCLAEFAFGANAAAWRVEGGKKVLSPTSLEAEKAYDEVDTTIHIAHGANYAFGVPKSSPLYNDVPHHTDHVLWGGINVEAEIEGGSWITLIENGRPNY